MENILNIAVSSLADSLASIFFGMTSSLMVIASLLFGGLIAFLVSPLGYLTMAVLVFWLYAGAKPAVLKFLEKCRRKNYFPREELKNLDMIFRNRAPGRF